MPFQFKQYSADETYAGQKKFNCGNDILNKYVRDNLKKQVKQKLCSAYVLLDGDAEDKFIGFFTLSQHTIDLEKLSELQLGSLPRIIPCTRLVMLGIDSSYQKQGLGKRLMREAFIIAKNVAEIVGSFGIYLDAEASAIPFYQGLGFVLLEQNDAPLPSPMFLKLSDIT